MIASFFYLLLSLWSEYKVTRFKEKKNPMPERLAEKFFVSRTAASEREGALLVEKRN